ncbi:MAG: hypothetical protein HY552_02955 [Elusimicrobia bacterium]|nr:hypothetical protein [Elusimicrobiota bacterium]
MSNTPKRFCASDVLRALGFLVLLAASAGAAGLDASRGLADAESALRASLRDGKARALAANLLNGFNAEELRTYLQNHGESSRLLIYA